MIMSTHAPSASPLLGLAALLFAACSGQEAGGAAHGAHPAAASADTHDADTDGQAPASGKTLQTLDSEFDLNALDSTADADERVAAVAGQVAKQKEERRAGGGLQKVGEGDRGSMKVLGDGHIFDHGVIRLGEARDHVFRLSSNGEDPLVIRGIKPSCGCTKAEIALLTDSGKVPYELGEEIPVGQEFELLTRISTVDKRPGDFAATVSVYTNDPRGPVSMQIKAQVEPVLVVEPEEQVHFRGMTSADVRESTITVRAQRGERFLLEPRKSDVKGPLSVELTPTDPDDDGRSSRWEVKVTLGPNAPIGMRNYPLVLVSDIPIEGFEKSTANAGQGDEEPVDTYTTLVAVQARVTGLVNAEPGFVSFGMVRPGQVVERVVRVECFDEFELSTEMPTVVEGLYGQEFPYADQFTWKMEKVEGGAIDLRLRLEGLPDDSNGSFGGLLKLSVGHPWMDELAIRFSGVCRPGISGG